LRLCLERIPPARKDAPVSFDLPKITTADDAAKASASVLSAAADGETTPIEGASVMGLIETYRRTLETTEFEARIFDFEDGTDLIEFDINSVNVFAGVDIDYGTGTIRVLGLDDTDFSSADFVFL